MHKRERSLSTDEPVVADIVAAVGTTFTCTSCDVTSTEVTPQDTSCGHRLCSSCYSVHFHVTVALLLPVPQTGLACMSCMDEATSVFHSVTYSLYTSITVATEYQDIREGDACSVEYEASRMTEAVREGISFPAFQVKRAASLLEVHAAKFKHHAQFQFHRSMTKSEEALTESSSASSSLLRSMVAMLVSDVQADCEKLEAVALVLSLLGDAAALGPQHLLCSAARNYVECVEGKVLAPARPGPYFVALDVHALYSFGRQDHRARYVRFAVNEEVLNPTSDPSDVWEYFYLNPAWKNTTPVRRAPGVSQPFFYPPVSRRSPFNIAVGELAVQVWYLGSRVSVWLSKSEGFNTVFKVHFPDEFLKGTKGSLPLGRLCMRFRYHGSELDNETACAAPPWVVDT